MADAPTTLGQYRDLSESLGLPNATAFFDQRIAKAPNGRDELVLADADQMTVLMTSLMNATEEHPT